MMFCSLSVIVCTKSERGKIILHKKKVICRLSELGWLFGDDAICFRQLRKRPRHRQSEQQAARDQDANHHDSAPMADKPNHSAFST
jgi:hypothetical protein